MNVRISAAILAVTAGILLSGCSGGDGKDGDDVATLASVIPPQATASSAAAVPQERPLIRTDTSSAEEDRLYALWDACLTEHGAGNGQQRKLNADAANGAPVAQAQVDPAAEARYKVAEKKCADKEPESVWERAKRLDPKYKDKLRDWVTCIRAEGIDAWESSDGFLSFESLPPDNQMKKVDACQDKAFGKG